MSILNERLTDMMPIGRISLVVACIGSLLHGPAWAQFSGSTQSATITTVEQARGARDTERVSLTGSLKNEVRRAQYLFADATGEIRVRIEHEFWRNRTVTPRDTLNIRGLVKSDVRGRFIDVYYFGILE